MRIGLQTWGTEGDVRPFIALAGGLVKAGHQVHLAATAIDQRDYSHYARQMGFEFSSVGTFQYSKEDLFQTVRNVLKSPNTVNQLIAISNTFMVPVLDEMFVSSQQLVAQCDFVIGHPMAFPLGAAAEIAGVLYAHVSTVTALYPSRYFTPPGLPALGTFVNRLFWGLGNIHVNLLFRSVVNKFRNKYDLPPIRSVIHEAWRSPVLNLAAVSPSLCSYMPDWDHTIKICGFFSLPTTDTWEMPEALDQFLKAGPPPVFMTFGSMASFDADPTAMVNLFIQAAKLANCRAIIQADWNKVHDVAEDDSIFRLTQAPHSRIFPQCAAVVHHGGAGTTQSATLAGIPSVIVVHCADQPFWGAVLHQKNIAPPPLFRRNITPQKLAHALSLVLSSSHIADCARRMCIQMSAEKGVETAISHIEEFMKNKKK